MRQEKSMKTKPPSSYHRCLWKSGFRWCQELSSRTCTVMAVLVLARARRIRLLAVFLEVLGLQLNIMQGCENKMPVYSGKIREVGKQQPPTMMLRYRCSHVTCLCWLKTVIFLGFLSELLGLLVTLGHLIGPRLDDDAEWSDGEPSDDETEQERKERTVPPSFVGEFFCATLLFSQTAPGWWLRLLVFLKW